MTPRDLIDFWMAQPDEKLFSADPAFDAELADRFGLLHAQAWDDDRSQRDEACAAADIYLAVQPPHKRAFTVLRRLMWSGMKAQH